MPINDSAQRIIVMRHGERSDHGVDATPEFDPALTNAGIIAVKEAAAKLKAHLGEAEARRLVVVVSPFLRTVQTAEALQNHGIGTDAAMIIDNSLCEVFGPSRIKASRRTNLHHERQGRGDLPTWGESMELANERYVTSFLRNADNYASRQSSGLTAGGGANRPRGASSTTDLTETDQDAACVRRTVRERGADARPMPLKPCHDVLLVTHGDAISAVVSHFYPARTVYETNFLSFVVMARRSTSNRQFYLEYSDGVSWIVDGVEHDDHVQHPRAAPRTPSPPDSEGHPDDGDELTNSPDVPASSLNRRQRTVAVAASSAVSGGSDEVPSPSPTHHLGNEKPRGLPKGSEDCGKTRAPGGTPPQSSELAHQQHEAATDSAVYHGQVRQCHDATSTSNSSAQRERGSDAMLITGTVITHGGSALARCVSCIRKRKYGRVISLLLRLCATVILLPFGLQRSGQLLFFLLLCLSDAVLAVCVAFEERSPALKGLRATLEQFRRSNVSHDDSAAVPHFQCSRDYTGDTYVEGEDGHPAANTTTATQHKLKQFGWLVMRHLFIVSCHLGFFGVVAALASLAIKKGRLLRIPTVWSILSLLASVLLRVVRGCCDELFI